MRHNLTVIIPIHRHNEELVSCLESVQRAAQHHSSIRLVGVLNGPGIHTSALPQYKNFEWMTIPEANAGKARNHGAKNALSDFVLFLDSDTLVTSDFFHSILNELANTPNFISALQLTVTPRQDPRNPYSMHEYSKRSVETRGTFNSYVVGQSTPLLDSCALIFRRQDFLAIHGFPESIARGEDRVLTYQAHFAGFMIARSASGGVAKQIENRSFIKILKVAYQENLALQAIDLKFSTKDSRRKRLFNFIHFLPPPISDPMMQLRSRITLILERVLYLTTYAFCRLTNKHPLIKWQSSLARAKVAHKTFRLNTQEFFFFYDTQGSLLVRSIKTTKGFRLDQHEAADLINFFGNADERKPINFENIKRFISSKWIIEAL